MIGCYSTAVFQTALINDLIRLDPEYLAVFVVVFERSFTLQIYASRNL